MFMEWITLVQPCYTVLLPKELTVKELFMVSEFLALSFFDEVSCHIYLLNVFLLPFFLFWFFEDWYQKGELLHLPLKSSFSCLLCGVWGTSCQRESAVANAVTSRARILGVMPKREICNVSFATVNILVDWLTYLFLKEETGRCQSDQNRKCPQEVSFESATVNLRNRLWVKSVLSLLSWCVIPFLA